MNTRLLWVFSSLLIACSKGGSNGPDFSQGGGGGGGATGSVANLPADAGDTATDASGGAAGGDSNGGRGGSGAGVGGDGTDSGDGCPTGCSAGGTAQGGTAQGGAGAGGSGGVACQDSCSTDDARRCTATGNRVERCQRGSEGCLAWIEVAVCTAPLGTCSNGNCAASCLDECLNAGASSCLDGGVVACGNHDGDACLEWSAVSACGAGETCSNGACSATCTDECSPGTAQCGPGGLRACGAYDADPCLDFGDPVPCVAPYQTCDVDACVDVSPPLVVISELLVNSAGSPDVESFVELYGPANGSVAGLSLVGVDGSTGADYVTIPLSGSFGADGLFVIAHPSAAASTLASAAMLLAEIDLRNGPDSLQLRWGTATVDAVGYGTFSGAAFAGEGNPARAPGVGESLGRDGSYTDTDDNSADFAVSGAISPGLVNPAPNLRPIAVLSCPAKVFVGAAATFDASGSSDVEGPLTYTLTFGDGGSQSGPTSVVQHTFAAADVYQVDLVVTDAGGLQGFATCQVTAEIDLCAGVTCTSPPPDACQNASTLRSYAAAGTCVAGTCKYAYADGVCSGGCSAGACQAPTCGAGACDAPPANTCSGNVLQRYASIGSCNLDTCEYAFDSVECGLGCFIDDCIAGSDETETPSIGTSTFHDADLQIDALGRPHIVYCNTAVRYRTRDEAGWRELTVDAGVGGAGCRVSMALGDNGIAHIGYFDPLNADLRYATVQGASVTPELVATQGNVGRGISMTLTPAGEPQAVYLDGFNQELVLAVRSSGTWVRTAIDTWSETTKTMDSQQSWYDGDLQVVVGGADADYASMAYYERKGGAWTRVLSESDQVIANNALTRRLNGDTHLLVSEYTAYWNTWEGLLYTIIDGLVVPGPGVLNTGRSIGSVHLRPGGNLEIYQDEPRRRSADDRGLIPVEEIWPSLNAPWIWQSYTRSESERWVLHSNLAVTTVGACQPDCQGRTCGDDKCGGSCGSCTVGSFCSPAGACGAWSFETIDPILTVVPIYDSGGVLQQVDHYTYHYRYTYADGVHLVDLGFDPATITARNSALDPTTGELYLAVAQGTALQLFPVTSGGAPLTYTLPAPATSVAFRIEGVEVDLFYRVDNFGDPPATRAFHIHDDGVSITAPVQVPTGTATLQRVDRDASGYLYLFTSSSPYRRATNATGSWQIAQLPSLASSVQSTLSSDGTSHFYYSDVISGNTRRFYRAISPSGTFVAQELAHPVGGTNIPRGIAALPDGRIILMGDDVTRPLFVLETGGTITSIDLASVLGASENIASWESLQLAPDGGLNVYYEGDLGGPPRLRRAKLWPPL